MSSFFRLSIIMVLVLATVALGFIAYNANQPKPVAQAPTVEQKAQEPEYYFATRELTTGTFVRGEDFAVRAARPDEILSGEEIRKSGDDRIELPGSLVVKYVDAGRPIARQDVVRPRERGFLASVLGQGARAISLNVDTESGVSGLIWPGDRVDIVLTQSGKGDHASPALSEIVLRNVRIIAIDQEIVEGVPVANSAAGKLVEGAVGANAESRKVARSVSLELSPEQVKKITLAKDLGKLSLAVRSAVDVKDTADAGAVFGSDVSPALASQMASEITQQNTEAARRNAEKTARQNARIACQNAMSRRIATVIVYAKGKHETYTVKKQGIADAELPTGCNGSAEMASTSAASPDASGEKAKE